MDPQRGREKRIEKELTKPVDHQMILYAYNMNLKQHQTLTGIWYNSKGQTLGSNSLPFSTNRYVEVIPGTHGESVYDFVLACYNNTITRKSQPTTEVDIQAELAKMTPEQ